MLRNARVRERKIMFKFCKLLLFISAIAVIAGLSTLAHAKSVNTRLNDQAQEIENLKRELAELKKTGMKTGYDHGFYIKSGDDDYMLKFRFYAQPYYEFRKNENRASANTFGIRRARILLSGHVFSPKVKFMIMPEMVMRYSTTTTTTNTTYTIVDSGGDTAQFTMNDIDTDNNDRGFRLLYLWGEYSPMDEFNIMFGEFKTPMHRQYTTGSNVNQFPNFPLTTLTEPFVPGFQTGINIWGKLLGKKFHYNLFGVNGSGFDRVNINKSMRVGTRLVYDIVGRDIKYSDGDYAYSEVPKLLKPSLWGTPSTSTSPLRHTECLAA